MTLINQNSIIGVTSITSTASSDVITFHTSDTTERLRIDTSGNATFGGNVSVAGVLTYEDVTSVDAVGLSTFQNGIHVTGGSVGIGTDNPIAKLQVYGDNIRQQGINPYIEFYQTNGTNTAYLQSRSSELRLNSVGALPLTLGTDDTERLRITSTGNVGIGTDNPTAPIHFYRDALTSDSTRFNLLLQDSSSYAEGVGGGINFGFKYDSAGNLINRSACIAGIKENGTDGNYASALTFHTTQNAASTSEKMRITSDGNVGIGLTNPSAKLAIRGSENTVVEIQPDIPSGASRILSFNRVSNAYRTLRLDGSEMKLETSSVPKLRIAANGNIGIGDDFDANNYARLTVYEDNYTYGRSLAPTSTGQYASSYSPPVGTFHYRNNTDSGAIGVRHYVQAEQGYPNAQGYLDVLIKNSGFYTIRIKASTGSADAAVATMLVYGLANNSNTNHPVVSITGASGGGNSNPTFASGHGKGSSNAVATFWWEVLNYNVNSYDCTMRIHTTHSNNQGLRAIIEECV